MFVKSFIAIGLVTTAATGRTARPGNLCPEGTSASARCDPSTRAGSRSAVPRGFVRSRGRYLPKNQLHGNAPGLTGAIEPSCSRRQDVNLPADRTTRRSFIRPEPTRRVGFLRARRRCRSTPQSESCRSRASQAPPGNTVVLQVRRNGRCPSLREYPIVFCLSDRVAVSVDVD